MNNILNMNLTKFEKYFENPKFLDKSKTENIFTDLDNFFNKEMKKYSLGFEEKIISSNNVKSLLNLKKISFENEDVIKKVKEIFVIRSENLNDIIEIHTKLNIIKKSK